MAFSNSDLVTYTKLTANRNSPRNKAITRISIHCYVGQVTAKQGCDYFASTSRKASCNYVVGKDGSIGLSVPERDRSWCTSSADNDNRAVTIETASDTTHPYTVTDKAYNALLDLCTDICKRNGKKKLLWFGNKTETLNYSPKSSEMVLTVHRWFASKACPGDYLYKRHGAIAEEVTRRLNETTVETDSDHAKTIWDYFLIKLGNEYGVAGLMGNLAAESGLHPDRVQGDIPYSSYSQEYTAKVDSGAISESDFVNNGPGGGGYGLAQWTFYTRKQGLYDLWKSGGYSSIGSIELAMDYLWKELQESYSGVVDTLRNATSIREASDKVLHDFERPADQSESVEEKRENLAIKYYNMFATGNNSTQPNYDQKSFFSKLLLYAIATDK